MCHYFLKLLINISKPAVYANYMQNHHFMTMSNEFRKIIIQSCKAVSDFIAEAALIRLLPTYLHPPLSRLPKLHLPVQLLHFAPLFCIFAGEKVLSATGGCTSDNGGHLYADAGWTYANGEWNLSRELKTRMFQFKNASLKNVSILKSKGLWLITNCKK